MIYDHCILKLRIIIKILILIEINSRNRHITLMQFLCNKKNVNLYKNQF